MTVSDEYSKQKEIITAQNDAIRETEKNMDDAYSTDGRKAMYESEMMRGNNRNIFLLFCFYYALCVIVAFTLYKSTDYSNSVKALIVVAFLLYPFVISMIEIKMYNIYEFLKAFLLGTIYSSSKPPPPPPPPAAVL